MSRPTLFLIDGSSQMYRAYHAFRGRGLSNQEGHTTHAVYVFVTMLRKLIADHKPAYIAASFDLAGPTFRDQIVGRLQGEPRGDARRPCRADQLGARGLRGAGRADPHRRGLRSRRRDRDAGAGGRRRTGSRSRSSRSTRISSSWSGDGVRVYDPREDGAWFDAAGVVEKFGVQPAQVVDVLALVGDTSDNVAGVPGIGKKGAIDLITQYGSLDALLEHAGRPQAEAARGAASRTARPRCRAASSSRSGRDVPVDVDFEALRVPRRVARALLRAVLRVWRSARSSTTTRRPPTRIEKDYALVRTSERARRAGRRASRGRRVRAARHSRPSRRRCARRSSASPSRPRDRQARYVPLGHEGAEGGGDDLLAGASAPEQIDAASRARPSSSRCSRTSRSSKVGHDLKFDLIVLARHGITLRGPRVRLDARQLPARRDAAGASARGDRRSSISATRR